VGSAGRNLIISSMGLGGDRPCQWGALLVYPRHNPPPPLGRAGGVPPFTGVLKKGEVLRTASPGREGEGTPGHPLPLHPLPLHPLPLHSLPLYPCPCLNGSRSTRAHPLVAPLASRQLAPPQGPQLRGPPLEGPLAPEGRPQGWPQAQAQPLGQPRGGWGRAEGRPPLVRETSQGPLRALGMPRLPPLPSSPRTGCASHETQVTSRKAQGTRHRSRGAVASRKSQVARCRLQKPHQGKGSLAPVL